VSVGEALGLPGREKAGVGTAVVAHGQRAKPQVDDLYCMRMTVLHLERVMMVAAVSRRRSTRRDLGHNPSPSHLFHDPLLLLGLRSFARNSTLTLQRVQKASFRGI
jgi:hypothetical protein